MEAHGRGGAGDIDPADQWVFNPDTGNYELRLPGARQPAPGEQPGRQSPPPGRGQDAGADAPDGRPAAGRGTPPRQRSAPPSRPGEREPATDRPVPPQRDRRAKGGGGGRSRRKTKKRGRGRKILIWGGGSLALLLVGLAGTAWYAYNRLNGNINKVETGIDNDYSANAPINVLFIGTDTRDGSGNESYGGDASEGADTTILMHFSEDRTHATGLSIPRDLITDIPDCEVHNEDGSTRTIPGTQGARFNQSMGIDGRDPTCVWRTVEELTGVEINHFMMADFNAVKDLSTAVGGVEVCLTEPIDDPKSHLDLPAGRHVIEGEEALAFVRTRSAIGQGSDLNRIELQQQFMASMAREITQSNVLTSLGDFWDLADAATRALTVDSGIGSIEDLYGLASEVRRVPMSDMSFITLPVLDNPDEPENAKATVIVDEARAEPIFQMLQQDISMTAGQESGEGGEGGGGEDAEQANDMVPAAEVRVDVFNGGDVLGAAQETLDWLQIQQGVPLSTNGGNAPAQETTTLEYGPDQAGQAARLAEMMGLPDSALREQSADAGDAPMVLVLGDDFRGAGNPIEVPAERPEDLRSIEADNENVCA
ncbi:LCP family protein [Streptomyces marincola]|uniref:LytR family transcriptional regulator n=1 Tax=Streptomyces marincola TaxID=2878388 RepID=A0A1W7D0C4_9ACTN|nr:LCP family protein [Streptomyces marincola]ARQ70369.1 LytR family transcriptional regulator [Streptomyces marincola]